ncbi:MAG TPA: polysaccharide deacetylase family protein [Brevibacillus sp.]|nr:polysaccharide deacetylase family protein [Brevibacillus sp.]
MPSKSLISTYNKWVRTAVSLIMLLTLLTGTVDKLLAAGGNGGEEPKILVVYTTETGTVNEDVRMLDLVLGHFSSRLHYVADAELTARDLDGVDYLVYYGAFSQHLPSHTKEVIRSFTGTLLAIGKNAEQLGERFSFLTWNEQINIQMVSKPQGVDPMQLDINMPIEGVSMEQGEVLLEGWKGIYAYPLMMKHENTAYFASSSFSSPLSLFAAEALHDVFGIPHQTGRLALIRLEDVHPQSDPKLVLEAGSYLADKGIPYVIALIPVYTNSETKELVHLKDRPELVEVLRTLQQRGASITLHGYMHYYRDSETGEGSEFWDMENNTPISKPPEDTTPLKTRYEWSSQKEYEQYRASLEQYEETYIKSRIESGIKELTELGLVPVAFEAPHYNMSQKGYQITSRYFSYLLGQVQFNQTDWHQMGAPPYISKPAFLHGMTLLPETVGYYDPNSPTPMQDIRENARQVSFVRDGVIGMFFHPYLGVEPLKEMIAYVETLPDVTWIDVRKMAGYHVAEEAHDTAVAQPEEELAQSIEAELMEKIVTFLREDSWTQRILWGIVALVTCMVLLFTLYTWRNRANLRKQLFMERDLDG